MAKFPVEGKVALITGAAGGIGFGTAQALVKRGAKVVLADLDAEKTAKAAASLGEGNAIGIAADVTDRAALDAAVAAAVAQFGRLDIVVANAGIAPPAATVRATTQEDFEAVIAVNQMGVWNTVQAALPQVIENNGHVQIISSIYAFFNGAGQSPYAMSKAAVEQLGRALRFELAVTGASAGVAYFGFIDTAMVQGALKDPLAVELVAEAPPGLGKKLPPAEAGEHIARGIEERAARVIAPRRWNLLRLIRGLYWPLDDYFIRTNKKLRSLVKRLDVPAEERAE
jgi:NAD(P)-dependent dehydrogenase (short-subunit alcohol dehydrogenase family)